MACGGDMLTNNVVVGCGVEISTRSFGQMLMLKPAPVEQSLPTSPGGMERTMGKGKTHGLRTV